MPFIDRKEPYIVDIHHGLVALFKPCGWHTTSCTPGDVSVPTWLFEHEDLLPSSELKEAIHEGRLRLPRTVDRGNSQNRGQADRFQDELGMLYRLDRETSGILLLAIDRSTLESMQGAQDSMALSKRYMLACTESDCGVPGFVPVCRHIERASMLNSLYSRKEIEVTSYFRSYGPRGARVACIAPEFARTSKKKITKKLYVTRYQSAHGADGRASVLPSLPPDAILIEAEIRKGFRHQLRAHSAWMGLPIVGDNLYGGIASGRLFLEAFSVILYDKMRPVAEWKLYDCNSSHSHNTILMVQ